MARWGSSLCAVSTSKLSANTTSSASVIATCDDTMMRFSFKFVFFHLQLQGSVLPLAQGFWLVTPDPLPLWVGSGNETNYHLSHTPLITPLSHPSHTPHPLTAPISRLPYQHPPHTYHTHTQYQDRPSAPKSANVHTVIHPILDRVSVSRHTNSGLHGNVCTCSHIQG